MLPAPSATVHFVDAATGVLHATMPATSMPATINLCRPEIM
ncbi:MAG: hypothetical protein ACLQPH_07425 [Acidimicrobiales bacterium]